MCRPADILNYLQSFSVRLRVIPRIGDVTFDSCHPRNKPLSATNRKIKGNGKLRLAPSAECDV